MGGIKTDSDGETTIPGLYAAGEVACVSVHGGNRLGANSLLDTLVFGRRSGEHAAARALQMPMPSTPASRVAETEKHIAAIMDRPQGGRRIGAIKNELGETMNEYVAVFRDEAGLTKAHEIVRRLKEEATVAAIDDRGSVFNQDVIAAIELGYMLDVAETIVVGALERKECRGAQWRIDYPGRSDDEWLKHIDISMNGADVPHGELLAGHDHPLAARGKDVLAHGRVHAQDPPLRPAVRRSPALGHPHRRPSPVQSVLDAILKIKDDTDGSIGIRCSCQQAICGSCGVRMNGKPGLACNTHLEEAAQRAHGTGWNPPDEGQDSPVITVEPMGNMPVIRDLIVDMDAVHWKKIQRVTPWLINKQPVPEREYIVPHENMVDVTQTMACIQCGACVSDCLSMEVDPEFIGPAALAKAYRFVGDPRDAQHRERLSDLSEDPHGLYDCTHCFNCIDACPKGVAPMSQIMRLRRIAGSDFDIEDRNNGYRHEHAFVKNIRRNGLLHEADLLPDSYGGKFHPRAVPELIGSLPTAATGLLRGQDDARGPRCCTRTRRRPRSRSCSTRSRGSPSATSSTCT